MSMTEFMDWFFKKSKEKAFYGHAGRPGKVGGSVPASGNKKAPDRKLEEYANFYKAGQKAKENGVISMNSAFDQYFDVLKIANYTETKFFEIGLAGAEMPYKVTGWRYGNIPKEGKSYNFREGQFESGVSLMEVYGGKKTQDEFSAMFIKAKNRPIVKVTGYLNTLNTGADGEPLLLDATKIE